MYSRLSAVLFPFLAVALIGTAVWGYQENQDKNSILIKAENQYQRAFHDLSYHVDKLHSELGNTLAVNSTSQNFRRKNLINISRLTSQAQNESSQLPLTLMPFNKTKEFLANMSDFSYRTAVRDLTKQPMTQDEMNTLSTLYQRSKEISSDLESVRSKVIAKNLRWMDVETALATEKTKLDNTIIDGFRGVDSRVGKYSELNWGPSMGSALQKRNYSALSGRDMSVEEIKKKAAQFLGQKDTNGITVVEAGKGTDYSTYSIVAKRQKSGNDARMDMTKRGGEVIWFMSDRPVQQKRINNSQARASANEFLQSRGYRDMKPVSYDTFDSTVRFVYAKIQNGVVIYPEKLTVKVAMDNAEVVGLQASDYILEHKVRQLKAPAVSQAEAQKALNPKFKTISSGLALIKNDVKQEVLCYQFYGKVNGASYRVYINAETGEEEQITQVHEEDSQAGAK